MQETDVFQLNNDANLKQLKKMVSKLKHHEIMVSPKIKAMRYEKNIWFKNPNRKFQIRLHSLKMIDYLLMHYDKTHDEDSVLSALQYFYLWYEENYETSQSLYSFHPVAITNRLLTISHLLHLCKTLDLCLLDDVFIEVISSHAKMLTEKKYYKKNSLMGISQDIALIVSSMIYNEFYIKDAFNPYIELSIDRLQSALDFYIDSFEKSYLGESFQKAYRLFMRLHQFYQFIIDKPFQSDFKLLLKEKMDDLYTFLYQVCEPGLKLPPIFVGAYIEINKDVILTYDHPLNQHFLYLATYGKEGNQLTHQHKCYEKANLCIVNQDVSITEDFYRVMFYNSFSNFHKHHDNLAFTLYYKDLLLFIDGNQNQDRKDRYFRDTIKSCYAHNTICVDSHDYQIDREQIGLCGMVNTAFMNEVSFLCGLHVLYEDVVIKRNLLMLPQEILIIDEIFAKEVHDYEMIFNLNPALHIQKDDNNQFSVLKQDHFIAALKPIFSTMPLKAFYNDEIKKFPKRKDSTHLIIYQGRGKNVLLISGIRLEETKRDIDITANKQYINIKISHHHYVIDRGDYHNELSVDGKRAKQDIIKHKRLLKQIHLFYLQQNDNQVQ